MYFSLILSMCGVFCAPVVARPTLQHAHLRRASSNGTAIELGSPEEILTAKIDELLQQWPGLELMQVFVYISREPLTGSWLPIDFGSFCINAYDRTSNLFIQANNGPVGVAQNWETHIAPMTGWVGPTFQWSARVFSIEAAFSEVRTEHLLLAAPGAITIEYLDHPQWAPDLAGIFYDFTDIHHLEHGAGLGPDGVVYPKGADVMRTFQVVQGQNMIDRNITWATIAGGPSSGMLDDTFS